MTIKPEEGFYQTFLDLDNAGYNIPEKDWGPLLEKVGPKLAELKINGVPFAYDMGNGEWGMRMVNNGAMPKEVLDIITDTHDQMTGVTTPPSVPVEVPTPTAQLPITEVAAHAPDVGGASTGVEALMEPINMRGVDALMSKVGDILPSEVAGNFQLERLTEVVPWMDPQIIAERMGISVDAWDKVEDYIAQQITLNGDKQYLYANVFNVDTQGQVHFITNKIPDATLADILNQLRNKI